MLRTRPSRKKNVMGKTLEAVNSSPKHNLRTFYFQKLISLKENKSPKGSKYVQGWVDVKLSSSSCSTSHDLDTYSWQVGGKAKENKQTDMQSTVRCCPATLNSHIFLLCGTIVVGKGKNPQTQTATCAQTNLPYVCLDFRLHTRANENLCK